MNRASHPDATHCYLGSDPHTESWTIYGDGGGTGDVVGSHVEEGGIAYHGNALILDHHIELDCGRIEVSLIGIDAFCDGTSYEYP